jgi:hypothetical protein
MHRPDNMPSEEDFAKLCDGLKNLLEERLRELKKNKNSRTWRNLAEVVLAHEIVYNGKRGGDVAQMKVADYVCAMNVQQSLSGAVYASLSEEEKDYAGRHFLISVKGKRNRINSIILTEKLKEAMDALLEFRHACEVLESNPFFFAVPGFSTYIMHSPVLKKFITQFGVSNMATRKIRKFIATVLQAKPGTLTVDQLARHLGHEFAVHNEFYRLGQNFLYRTVSGILCLEIQACW